MGIEKAFLNDGYAVKEFHGVNLERISKVIEFATSQDAIAMERLAKLFANGKPVPWVIFQAAREAIERTERRMSTRFAPEEDIEVITAKDINWWPFVGFLAAMLVFLTGYKGE